MMFLPHHLLKSVRTVAAAAAALAIGVAPLAACGSASSSSSKGSVYYLNTKPEVIDQLQAVAKEYTKETGVPVRIRTAASGTSNSTLTSELAKSDGPSVFNLAGYDQYIRFHQFLTPLQNTRVYKLLNAEGRSYAFGDSKNVYTIPYAGEWYGIIYNKAILNRYVKKPYAVIKSVSDLKNYDTLKKVAQSMQSHKADLGITGAFSTPGLDESDNYRFVAHMPRIPFFYEMRDRGIRFSNHLKGTYLPEYKNLWDLEMRNSPTDPKLIGSKNYTDCTNEFATGKVAFYPNGVWSYAQIKGHAVKNSDLGMLPYWMGIKGESKYGPFSVYDANWAINSKVSKANQKASLKFLYWLVTSNYGRRAMSKEMGFSSPFTTFTDKYQPDNPLTTAARAYQKRGMPSPFSVYIPGQQWQDDIANALLEYAQGTGKWSAVVKAMIPNWTSQWASYKSLPPAGKFNE